MFHKLQICIFCLLSSILLTSCFKTKSKCPNLATFEKIKGISPLVLEKPLDKTKVKLGSKEFLLMVNKNSQVIIHGDKFQQVIMDLKLPNGKKAFYAEIDWAGDNNKDCKVDLVIWKKLGVYIGKYEVKNETHEKSYNEKFFIESQANSKDIYKIQSLGVY